MSTSSKDRFKIPKEHLEAIGSITVNFSMLERILMLFISKLMSPTSSELSKRLIAGDSFMVLLSKFKKLVIYRLENEGVNNKQLTAEIKSFCNNLENIATKRDKIMHSLYFLDKDENIMRTKFKKNINENPGIVDVEIITLPSLNDFLKQIDDGIVKIFRLREKIIKLLSL